MKPALNSSFNFLLGVVLVTGCNIRDSRTIAVIPETTGTELWEAAHAGAELAGSQEGYKIYWNAPTRADDLEGQIQLVEQAVRNHTDGIVLAPDHSLALLTVVQEAEASKVPVAIIHSPLPIPENASLAYFLNNDHEMGIMAANRAGLVLHGKGAVAMIGMDPSVMGVLLRSQSFESALHSSYPGIEIVERRSGSENPAATQRIVAEVLRDHPDLDAIVAFNSVTSEGSWAALNALHRTGKVRLIGCDQEIDLMAGIRHGDIDSILIENSYEMGRLAVKWVSNQKRGLEGPQRVYILPVLVTKENINDPTIQRILSVDWRVRP